MKLLIQSIFCCSLFYAFASSLPQWLFEEIHALHPGNKGDHMTDPLHPAKKSDIPEHKKRKDGVKRLFKFLDYAVQESANGSGEGSTEERPGVTGLPAKQVTKTGYAEGKKALISKDVQKQTLSGYDQQQILENQASASEKQGTQMVSNKYATPVNRLKMKTAYISSQKTPYFAKAKTKYQTAKMFPLTDFGETSSEKHLMYNGHEATSIRSPAIPVRSGITPNPFLIMQQHYTASSRHFVGGLHRSNIQSPYYFTYQYTPNRYDRFYMNVNRAPAIRNGKSLETLQEKPYGQPKRPRDEFHQRIRGLIPGRVSSTAYSRYPSLTRSAIGQDSVAISPEFSKLQPSRARLPHLKHLAISSPSFSSEAYNRNVIRQKQSQQSGLAFAIGRMRDYGYLLSQAPVARGLIERKPQPRNALTSLTAAAATARPLVPA